MAVIRYILDRSAYDNPSRWNPAELRGPLLSDLLHGTGHIVVPVKKKQVMHVYEMHHVMAHLPLERWHQKEIHKSAHFRTKWDAICN